MIKIKNFTNKEPAKSLLQIWKQVNPPPVLFVSSQKFENSINFAQEMVILPPPSDFTTSSSLQGSVASIFF